jgi:hypothetical protein
MNEKKLGLFLIPEMDGPGKYDFFFRWLLSHVSFRLAAKQ